MLMDTAVFDFATNVSRGTDLSASSADTRSGHHVHQTLTPAQVERGRAVFVREWGAALTALPTHEARAGFEAMELLRRPVARATCAAVLEDLDAAVRDEVADLVLGWIDALAPVISGRRAPGRWSRRRRVEQRARLALNERLSAVLAARGAHDTPPVVATMLAAGIQVPIAAGAWLLVHLAARPDEACDPDHAVWEALRLAPPTWITARVTTARVELGGEVLSAGELVLVSPLLLGRLPHLAPEEPADLATFCPERWRRDDIRPGAWLPFGAGPHACPGRTLGLGLLRDLAAWAQEQGLALAAPVTIDQSRGILPSPAHITCAAPTQ